ncbi:adenylyl-sulfate reductase subunit alpha [Herbivorax sp. ANBcel31]|uniref:adenylyl-sulfate reductase subunit alpha n=1 Tax=Herbivorax sp. ANBcel31 TaxID=3069754 RepID=UPI0027B1ACE5|nr:adenylyl-sulfate reductase subunit alpha [Herbivorax sp. ANBcel31]MDQ2085450.1 adenylyl-sulfate reductase subunit alpha [Herbivorax sp. ANBcel31]
MRKVVRCLELQTKTLKTDILVIGGGTSGCFAAITIGENSNSKVIIAEKANIKRSGCLAAGVNALNAYIVKGQTPKSYLEYVKNDSEGLIREDLVYSISKRFNSVTRKIESLGLVIQKDEKGEYVSRGTRNIKINGENIKPILAEAVEKNPDIKVLNRVNIIDYIKKDNRIIGAYGFSNTDRIFYVIFAKAVICTTGGAAGLYKPNNPGFSRHKMWYCPFNTGAGYGMGIRAGAEMTTFEMRFIALRCKDTIAPTGTIAQGVKAPQVNSDGEEYEKKYGSNKTSMRLFSTVEESRRGKGPCFLKTLGISKEEEEELLKAYLNMAPAQTLKWIETNNLPSSKDVEIEGTEPYITGGHTGSGYWVDTKRATTIEGLYAAGDVAGGSPQKYVTGCFAEGEIAAFSALEYIKEVKQEVVDSNVAENKLKDVVSYLGKESGIYSIEEIEEAMQKAMDQYAGGIYDGYSYNLKKLQIAKLRIDELLELSKSLKAKDMHELMLIFEVIDRLFVCKILIRHLEERKETRWRSFQENKDYPEKDNDNFLRFINSCYEDGEIKVKLRDLVKRDDIYEHYN